MNFEISTQPPSGHTHLSDDDLIAFLYLEDQAGAYALQCSACRERLLSLRAHREKTEAGQLPTLDVSSERLAAQRRAIYAALQPTNSLWSGLRNLKLLSATAAAGVVLAGGLFLAHDQPRTAPAQDTISDAELAREVSLFSQNMEAAPAQPLEGLFE